MIIPNLNIRTSYTSNFNFIVIFDCLNENIDISTPRRNHEDLRVKLIEKDTPDKIERNLKLIKCSCAHIFLDSFKKIEEKFNTPGFKPTFIIHAHGDKEKGLQLPDNSFIGWPTLIQLFHEIINKCSGDLTIIAGFCHSNELINHISKTIKLPFSFYYGYDNIIAAGIVENEINIILKSFINNGGASLHKSIKNLKIKCYSEFDLIEEYLPVILSMAADPATTSKILPVFSQKNIKETVRKGLKGPQSGMDKKIKHMIRSDWLAKDIVNLLMHDTERRKYVLQAVNDFFSTINISRL